MFFPIYARFRSVTHQKPYRLAYVDYMLLSRLHLTWTRVNGGRGALALRWGRMDSPASIHTLIRLPCPRRLLVCFDQRRERKEAQRYE
jgi:hypothetical protein